jgi:ATP adenylyltransferase
MASRPLWAPWRIEYITAETTDRCPFCVAADGDDPDAALVVERAERCFTMLNAFPYASGHLMTVPFRHVGAFEALEERELSEMMSLAQRSITALTEVMEPEGFNLGLNVGAAAGAGIDDHLHLHVVPRWSGDTNFMPVVGDVHVLPQALTATRDALTRALARMP